MFWRFWRYFGGTKNFVSIAHLISVSLVAREISLSFSLPVGDWYVILNVLATCLILFSILAKAVPNNVSPQRYDTESSFKSSWTNFGVNLFSSILVCSGVGIVFWLLGATAAIVGIL